ncbi:hypothetical protein B5X24_HaOG210733 [Helicoverpa armigera]|uniref:WD repeat-containing protein CG11141 n=1 Tax=Helicoverpa armigera TaxID=29058 RepID=A0A2W1BG40_HELAM|nr:hypothetical protein B5X24_HaOG210733 [Helicoverpa armigera]
MEVTGGAEEGFVREWAPCSHILNLIPPRIQTGIFSNELCLTCVDAVSEYIALGTNVGLVYWYDRKKGNIQRLRCEASTSPITYVKIVSTVDYMVGAGNAAGQVTVFQIPKEHPENVPESFKPKVEPKVERYTIGDLHKSKITAIEWSKNGMRLFSGDKNGVIIMTEIDFYMPSTPIEHNLGPLHVFREHFLVSHNDHVLYILDPRSLTAVAVVDDLRRILSVSVNKDEIFVLEGPRSLVRLAHAPEPAAMLPEEPINMMTKSLTTSIQQAVNTVRDLTHLDQTVPYISSVLEQPISMFTKNELIDTGAVASAEECFELPPIKHLPLDLSENVLESIVNEFRDVSSDAEEIRRVKTEELQRKLKLYNSIMEKKYDGELIHSSRRSRRREGGSGGSTPRLATPVRKPPDTVSYTSPCVMNISVYGNIPQQNDELLEKQIEEKEKILAKMLNLESLSIDSPKPEAQSPPPPAPVFRQIDIQPAEVPKPVHKVTKTPIKDPNPIDLVPKVVQLPNTWNLESIELKLDSIHNGFKDRSFLSPDENLDSEWEII